MRAGDMVFLHPPYFKVGSIVYLIGLLAVYSGGLDSSPNRTKLLLFSFRFLKSSFRYFGE